MNLLRRARALPDLPALHQRLEDLPFLADSLSLSSLLASCGDLRALSEGRQIHASIHLKGRENLIILCHGLISMYGKCGSFDEAQTVFDKIEDKNVVSWNSIISVCVRNRNPEDAIRLFRCMKEDRVRPNRITFMTILGALDGCEMLDEGKLIHAYALENGLSHDVAVGSALVNMYCRCGDLGRAKSLFGELSVRDVVSWNGLFTACVQHGHIQDAFRIFSNMLFDPDVQPNNVSFTMMLNACVSKDTSLDCMIIHATAMEAGCERSVMIGNALINSYGKCESLLEARVVFEAMPERDVVSWNTLILVCAQNGYRREALRFFHQMQPSGVKPSEISYITTLSLCTDPAHLEDGRSIHLSAMKNRLESNTPVANSLLCMYSNCGSAESAHQMFEKIRDRSVLTWTAIISACERHGLGMEAQMHFSQMLREGFMPNEYTLTSVVAACGSTVALEEGRLIHALASESSFDADDIFMNALVSMYGRCGTVEDASTIFERMRRSRSVVTWTALLASYAQHGDGCGAIQRFHRMHGEGLEANEISFVSVISACSHAGLVLEGCCYFSSMFPEFGILPIATHYSCLMDLFGRTGELDMAAYIIDQMPFQPDSDEWYTLLCSCKSQGDVGRGKCAAEHVLELYPAHSAAYVSLSNIYASAGTGESC